MATTTMFDIPGFPTTYLIKNNERITIRPMVPGDKDGLLEFFRRIPEEDRYYLKEDVTSPRVIERWAETVDYGRALPLLALMGDRIIGDGTLHHRRAGARRHIGEVRVVVDPEYRNRGVGRGLLHKLMEVAKSRDIDALMFEAVADKEEAAIRTAQVLGFTPVAVLNDHVQGVDGAKHNLVLMEYRFPEFDPDELEIF
jgi:GNAT superfamily N-acetyltransferase